MGESQCFANYFTARRLTECSYNTASQGFRSIVLKCLHCNVGYDSGFKSPALQYDLIGGLENLELVLRELQLDEPEPLSVFYLDKQIITTFI
jgi:hypothetical protein